MPAEQATDAVEQVDRRAREIVESYTWGAAGAIFAIPVPGVDVAAMFAVWGKMIAEIGHAYNYDVSLEDAKRLASDLFRGAVLTAAAWFGSAKLASGILKFIPGAGTITAYVIDALIAAFGARKVTSGVGFAAAAYFKSGKTLAPNDLMNHVKNVMRDPESFMKALAEIVVGFSPDDNDFLWGT